MSYSNTEGKNPEYVARGLKASIHNESVSDEAKERAAQRLQDMGVEVPADYQPDVEDTEMTSGRGAGEGTLKPNQERGYKSTLTNPNVSEEAKQHAQDVLEENGTSYEGMLKPNQERGYKSTLTNPNVSEEAKQHAQDVLEENGTSY